jgi:uncharacterized integral membrane protein
MSQPSSVSPFPAPEQSPSASARLTDHLTPRRVVALVLVALIAVVIGQNRSDVRIQVLFVETTLPLWLALTATALVGALVGALLARRSLKRAQAAGAAPSQKRTRRR